MKIPATTVRRIPYFEFVHTGRGDIYRVFHPLAGPGPADIVPAAHIGSVLDVHGFSGPVLAAVVRRIVVVVGRAFAAEVEVLSLDGSGNRARCSAQWRLVQRN